MHSFVRLILVSPGRGFCSFCTLLRRKEMVFTNFNGAGIGFGFGIGCGFGVGWGFGGMPLNFMGLGVGGGCGVGIGLGWGFGTAFGSQYRSSRITFQGVKFDSKEKGDTKELSSVRTSR